MASPVDTYNAAVRRAVRQASAFRQANEAMARLNNRAFRLGRELDRLRNHAVRFDTPRWQRPYWRLRVRLKLREIARNVQH